MLTRMIPVAVAVLMQISSSSGVLPVQVNVHLQEMRFGGLNGALGWEWEVQRDRDVCVCLYMHIYIDIHAFSV